MLAGKYADREEIKVTERLNNVHSSNMSNMKHVYNA